MWMIYLTEFLFKKRCNSLTLIQSIGILKRFTMPLLLFFIVITWINPAPANVIKQSIEKPNLVPAVLLEWNRGNDYAVLVDKSQQKVMLYNSENLYTPVKVYECSTGENNGPKLKKNDRKTPEGIYYFTNSVSERYLSPIYGVRALPINYPNIVDKKEGRSGYGIWFHGTNKPIKPYDSNGCIVLDNKDIEELAKYIKLFDTPIIISSKIEMVYPDTLEKDKRELIDIVEEWRKSWQDKDIEKYIAFYSRKFTSGSKNWSQWKEYKARLAKKYKEINVEIDDLNLLSNNGVVVATFKQHYNTPSFESYGTKRLYITKNSEEWRIIGETFTGEEKPRVAAKKVEPFSMEEVENFISTWKNSWEKKDINSYIACYDKDFHSDGMNLTQWKNHKIRLNKKYGSINVEIEELKVNRLSDSSASADFRQIYQADGYKDVGNKKLVLIKKGKDWKIKEEIWTP